MNPMIRSRAQEDKPGLKTPMIPNANDIVENQNQWNCQQLRMESLVNFDIHWSNSYMKSVQDFGFAE